MTSEYLVLQRDKWLTRSGWAYLIAVFTAYALIIFGSAYPPAFVDYPDWAYQGALFHKYLSHHAVSGYRLKHYPVPNSLTTVGIGLLNYVVDWNLAAKIWICVYFLSALFATYVFLSAIKENSAWSLFVVPGAVFLNLNFWFGHISFELGMCFFLILTSILLKQMQSRWIHAFLLSLLYFTHMEACACGLLMLLGYVFVKKKYTLLWQAVPAIALIAWYIVARFGIDKSENVTLPSQYSYASLGFLFFKINTYFKTVGYINATSTTGSSLTEFLFGPIGFILLICLSFIAGSIFLVIAISYVLDKDSGDQLENSKILVAFFIALTFVACSLPQSMLGTADPGSRMFLIVIALISFVGLKSAGRMSVAIASLSVVFCLANLYQFVIINRNPYVVVATQTKIPHALLQYAHIEVDSRLRYYEALEKNEFTLPIFTTGLFVENLRRH